MKILPSPKLLIISFVIAAILNIGELTQVNGMPKLIAYFIDTFIYAILIIVALRIAVWIGKKAGIAK